MTSARFEVWRREVRFVWESGIREATRIWTAALVGVTVAAGLGVSIPVRAWSAAFRDLSWIPRTGVALGAAAVLAGGVLPLLRRTLRGITAAPRLALPFASATSGAIDAAAAAALFAVPLAALLAMVSVTAPPALAIGMLLVAAGVPILAAALLDRFGARSSCAVAAFALLALSGAHGSVPGAAGALVALAALAGCLGLPAEMPEPGRERATRRHLARGLAVPAPDVLLHVRNEIAWISRVSGWRRLLEATVAAMVCAAAAILAIRTNAVQSDIAALRIALFTMPLGAAALGATIAGLWWRARPWRTFESVLPPMRRARVLAYALLLAGAATVPAVVLASGWRHGGLALLLSLFGFGAALAIVTIAGAGRATLSAGALLGWGGAAALAGAAAPWVALPLAPLGVVLVAWRSRIILHRSDHPLAEEVR